MLEARAEDVESEHQRAVLEALGYDGYQGFLYSWEFSGWAANRNLLSSRLGKQHGGQRLDIAWGR